MEEQELQKQNEEKNSRFNKWTWIKLIICLVVGALIAGIVYVAQYFNDISLTGETPDFAASFVRYSVDAFGISGILLILLGVLNFVASRGIFDALNYSMQLLFVTIFRPKYRETGFPKTLYDYKVKMDLKGRKPVNAIWLSGIIYFIAGIVFLIIYHSSI